MKGILALLTIFMLLSCTDDQWKSFPENKFLGKNKIDTTKYHTLGEIFKGKKVKSPSYEAYSFYHFDVPMALDEEYVFIEKKHATDKNTNVILKLDRKGNIVDSIAINKHASIVNNYIMEKDYYISWFLDSDKTKKTLVNKDYFLESDTIKIKSLVADFKKNKVVFWSTREYGNGNDIILDTCNYIISFKNKKPIKHNYLKKIRPDYELKINNENPNTFSKRFRNIEMPESEEYLKVDNFYAYSSDRLVKQGNKIHGSDLFSNTGQGNVTHCNSYKGTYFFRLLGLKVKVANREICDSRTIEESANKPTIYSADFLGFYLIDLRLQGNGVPDYYYVLKK